MEHTATSQAGAGTQGVDLGDARSQAILFRIAFGGPRVIPGSTPESPDASRIAFGGPLVIPGWTPESPDASRIAFGGPLANPGLYIYIYICSRVGRIPPQGRVPPLPPCGLGGVVLRGMSPPPVVPPSPCGFGRGGRPHYLVGAAPGPWKKKVIRDKSESFVTNPSHS